MKVTKAEISCQDQVRDLAANEVMLFMLPLFYFMFCYSIGNINMSNTIAKLLKSSFNFFFTLRLYFSSIEINHNIFAQIPYSMWKAKEKRSKFCLT